MIVDLQLTVDGLIVKDLKEVETIINDFEKKVNTTYPIQCNILYSEKFEGE